MSCLKPLYRLFLLAAAGVCVTSVAHAQGGSCNDPWINQGYNAEFHRAPSGSGTSGECNINLYGAGSWTSQQDLFTRIVQSKDCQDPWIGQIYWYLYGRRPSAQECVTTNYGGGSWSSYMDLTSKIQAYHNRVASTASTPNSSVLARGTNYGSQSGVVNAGGANVINAGGANVVAAGAGNLTNRNGSNVINAGGANVINAGGANLANRSGGSVINAGGANVVAAGAGNLISAGGINQYRVQSVPSMPHAPAGKYLVASNGALVDQNGNVVRNAGAWRVIVRNGSYVFSASGYGSAPVGAVVLPQ